MKVYLCASASAGFFGFAVRLLTTLAMRRMAIKKLGITGWAALAILAQSFVVDGPLRKIRAHVNHVFLLYKSDIWSGWFCGEIDKDGPTPKPAEKVLKRYKYVEVWDASYDIVEGMRKTKNMLDTGYDWRGIGGFLLAIIKCIKTGEAPINMHHAKNKSFCSEYVALCINRSPGSVVDLAPESTTPMDLASMWMTSPLYDRVTSDKLREMGVPLR